MKQALPDFALIYVVYHYSRAKRASAEGGKYSVISGIQRISNFASDLLLVYKIPYHRERA